MKFQSLSIHFYSMFDMHFFLCKIIITLMWFFKVFKVDHALYFLLCVMGHLIRLAGVITSSNKI